ncbi:site-specific DNA-methyltransferase [Asticcacaulis sp. EMRT-3]|uniref:site-specific DNA-methyltransferase n=1 Tax=Asticcacaulis sp. EMRT-3 TaxID=3040349 RepID=UPI0024AED01D|nr:site-specific DNA-methyltransferase [Asticcacaulis sp. EMRT-3]MDI7775597.1 site-specific DNA-methyltransferase [Asticcacaulis sp. EMRT-3]
MTELNFKGKEFVYNHHLAVPFRPLEPDAAKGIGPVDLSGNLIIQGDNLHALKALLPMYAGKVDCIFIDPPYNTGNEGWAYNDNVNAPMIKAWLESNPIGIEDGLRHDKWCAMMWPRLRLLHELLAETGSIWITLDDNEVQRGREILDEIFGPDKFIACCVWQKRYSRENREAIGDVHDYVLVYSKSPGAFKALRNKIEPTEEQLQVYKNPNNDPKGRWRGIPMTAQGFRKNQMYTVTTDTGVEHIPPEGRCWSMIEKEFNLLREQGRVWFGQDGNGQPNIIRYADEIEGFVPWTWWPSSEVGHTDEAKKEMHEIFGREDAFSTPKPLRLISRIVGIATKKDSIILDSFAGSGTTAHAVLEANRRDGGNRKFILVEMEDYADRLTAERVRRVIKGYDFQGTQKTELLRESLNWRTLTRAADLVHRVDGIENLHAHEYDAIKKTVKDGELIVTGEKTVAERTEGLSGSFTYCTLGAAIDLDAILTGDALPSFANLGAALFHMATNRAFEPSGMEEASFYLGTTESQHVWLIYQPDLEWLKSPDAALTLSRAKAFAAAKADGKKHLVFAPARYVSQKLLAEQNIPVEFVPLPFALYRMEQV